MDVENALPPPADPVTPATSPSKRAAAAGDLYPWVGPSQAEIERSIGLYGSYVPTPRCTCERATCPVPMHLKQ